MKEYGDKEQRILDTAADLFARQPFHKVLLSDVARVAAVGKGTLYLYFKSKEALYFAVLFREFSILVDRMRDYLDTGGHSPAVQMNGVVRILADHLFAKAYKAELLSFVVGCPITEEWRAKRRELWDLMEGIIRRGLDQGVFRDEDPKLTARFVTGLVRSACLFAPEGMDEETLCLHAQRFILRGLEA
jgi:AcrR family transcriptional regulator